MNNFVNPNLKVVFDRAEVITGVSKHGEPYTALDIFVKHSGVSFSHRLFDPKDSKPAKYRVNGFIKNMVDELGGELPPSGFTFDSFKEYIEFVAEEVNKLKGVVVYVKMLKNDAGWHRFGYTLPVFSNTPHMEWSPFEMEKISVTSGVVKDETPIQN